MTFQLTAEHVHSFLDPASVGNWQPFVGALDPDVRWIIGSEDPDPTAAIGVFNVASWTEEVQKPLFSKLEGGVEMKVRNVDASGFVVGNKCFAECYANGMQKNGRPYNQTYLWVLIFSEQTGKVVEIREYLNTALVKEVLSTNTVDSKST